MKKFDFKSFVRRYSSKGFVVEEDKENISKLVSEGEKRIEELKKIDERLAAIQKSTKASISFFTPVHNYCRVKYKWYYNWHLKPYATKVHFGVLLTIILTSLFTAGLPFLSNINFAKAETTDCHWVGNVNENWSTAGNWSCGAVPGASHNVILGDTLSGADAPLNIDTTATAASFAVLSDYTQAVTLNANFTLDKSQGGTGNFTLNGGTFNAGGGVITVPGSWNSVGGIFNRQTSIVTLNPADGDIVTLNVTDDTTAPYTNSFYTFITENSSAVGNATINIVSHFQVDGDYFTIGQNTTLSFAGTAYNLRLNSAESMGFGYMEARIDGAYAKGTGKMIFATDSEWESEVYLSHAGTLDLYDLEIGTDNVNGYENRLIFNGDISMRNFTLGPIGRISSNGQPHNFYVSGNYTEGYSGGYSEIFEASVVLNGSSDQTLQGNAVYFQSLTINNTGDHASGNDDVALSGALKLNSDASLTVTTGDLNIGSINIDMWGNLNIGANGYITKGSGIWTFKKNGTSSWTDSTSGQDLGAVVIQAQSGATTVDTSGNPRATSINIDTGDTLTIGYSILTITGTGTPLTKNGTFNTSFSTVKYTGSAATNITTTPYNVLQLSGSGPYNLTGNLTGSNAITGNLTIDSGSTLMTRPATTNYNITAVNFIINGTLNTPGVAGQSTTLSVSGNWTNNGTFIPGNSTVSFTGASAQINGTAATQTFSNFTVAKTSGQTLSVGGNTTTLNVGTLTLTSGNFTAPATFNASSLALTAGTFTAGTNTTVSGNLTLNPSPPGTFIAGANVDIGGNWINNGGAFTPGSGTVTFNGGGAQAINGTAVTQTFATLTVAKTAGQTLSVGGNTTTLNVGTLTLTSGNFTAPATFNISSNVTLTAGTFIPGANVNVGGNWTNNGAAFSNGTPATGSISYTNYPSDGNTVSISDGTNVAVVEYDNNGDCVESVPHVCFSDVSSAAAFAAAVGRSGINVTATASASTVNFVNNNVGTAGNVQIIKTPGATQPASISGMSGGTNPSGTVVFNADAPNTQTLTSGGDSFYNLTHSGAGTLQLADALTLTGTLTNSSNGTFDANGQNISVAGNFNISGGSFSAGSTPGTQTVTLNGAGGTTQTVSGSNTFNNLTAAATTARTISFVSGTTQTINNALSLNGVANNLLTLSRSGGSGTDQWNINLQNGATQTLAYLDVSNSNATGEILAAGYTSQGALPIANNTRWEFNRTPSIVTDSLAPADQATWSADTTPDITFTTNDADTGQQLKYQIQIDNNADFSSLELDYTSNLMAQGAKTFTIGQAAGSGTYTAGAEGQTLSDGQYYLQVRAIDDFLVASPWEIAGVDATADYKIDTTGPTGSISIDSDETYTNNAERLVTLTLSSTDISSGNNEMMISNSSDFAGASWEAYSETKNNWELTASDGSKTVYAKFRDTLNNESITYYSDTITLDLIAPSATTPSASSPTNDTTPTWSWDASTDAGSGISRYYVKIGTTEGGSQILAETATDTTSYTPSALTQGIYYLSVKAKDVAGNMSAYTGSTALTLDTTAPTGSVIINSESDQYATNGTVTLNLSATDTGGSNTVSQMAFSNDNITYTAFETYAVNKTYTLSSGDGAKTVYVKYKDGVGNISTACLDSITLDTTGPGNFSLFSPLENGWTNSQNVTFTWENAVDEISGLAKYQFYLDGVLNKDNIDKNTTSLSLENLSAGSHKWYVAAIDTLGQVKNASERTFGIDLETPGKPANLKATNLSNSGLSLTNQEEIKLAFDKPEDKGGSGISSYQIFIGTAKDKTDILNGEEIPCQSGDSEASACAYTSKLSKDGTYYITLKAKDRADNASGLSDQISFKLDLTKPIPVSKAKAFDVSNRIVGKYYSFLIWSASADSNEGSGIKEYIIKENGREVGRVSFLGQDNKEAQRAYTGSNLAADKYTYKVEAVDQAGNTGPASPDTTVELAKKESFAFDVSNAAAKPSTVVDTESGKTSALITWNTSSLSTGTVEVDGKAYGSENLDELNFGHSVLIPDLKASTTYHYKVKSKDIYGNEKTSGDLTFRTNAIVKKQTTLEILIRTLEDVFSLFKKASAAGLVKLGILKPAQVLSQDGLMVLNVSDPEMNQYGAFISLAKGGQTIEKSADNKNFTTLSTPESPYYADSNLEANKTYYYRVKGASKSVSIRPDDKDEAIPSINGPKIMDEATEISDDKVQIAIVWQTDKPSTSQIQYGIGSPSITTTKDENLNTSHLVVLENLKPASTYNYIIKSEGENGKEAVSKELTFATPATEQRQSILELIAKSLEDALKGFLSWVRK